MYIVTKAGIRQTKWKTTNEHQWTRLRTKVQRTAIFWQNDCGQNDSQNSARCDAAFIEITLPQIILPKPFPTFPPLILFSSLPTDLLSIPSVLIRVIRGQTAFGCGVATPGPFAVEWIAYD